MKCCFEFRTFYAFSFEMFLDRRISETQIKSPKEVSSCQSQNNRLPDSVDSDKQSGVEAGGAIDCLGGCGSSYDMFELIVVGNAFLWHQIRCIVAVLLLIGEGKESPQVHNSNQYQ